MNSNQPNFSFPAGFSAPRANQPGMTSDFSAGHWLNNSFGHTSTGTAVNTYEVPCRQQDAWVYNNRQCENQRHMNQVGGGVGGAFAGGVAASQVCTKIPNPALGTLCTGAFVGAAAGWGAKAGLIQANGSQACMLIVNGAGECVDASHNHRR